MTSIIILAVVAAWAAVLLPPLLRSKGSNRPGSSVSDFSRQLSTLQRSVPTRGMAPMRSMTRPLVQSQNARPVVTGRASHQSRSNVDTSLRARQQMHAVSTDRSSVPRRIHGEPTAVRDEVRRHEELVRHAPPRHGVSNREEVRRRRSNMVFMLLMATVATLFLAATTHAPAMMYAFAFSFLALCGYCYKLSQLRLAEQDRQHGDATWFRAA